MKSPLALDRETVKKFNIKDDVAPVAKMSFLQDQLQQLEATMWRSRIDILHATRLTESINDTLKQKGHQQLATHLNEVAQFTGAIEMIKTLINELRQEYQELQVEE